MDRTPLYTDVSKLASAHSSLVVNKCSTNREMYHGETSRHLACGPVSSLPFPWGAVYSTDVLDASVHHFIIEGCSQFHTKRFYLRFKVYTKGSRAALLTTAFINYYKTSY